MTTPTQQTSAPWAKLVSVQPNLTNQDLFKDSYTIGTETSSDIQIQPNNFKGNLCRIYKTDSGCWLESLGSNDIYVGQDLLDEGETKQIFAGDIVYFLYPSKVNSEVMGYIISGIEGKGNNDQPKRKREQETEVNDVKMSDKQVKNSGNDREELLCGICADYLHQCVTAGPCKHDFCGACLTESLLKSKQCPKCQQEMIEVEKNDEIRTEVKKFLKNNPTKKRPQQEELEMNRKNKLSIIKVRVNDIKWIPNPAKRLVLRLVEAKKENTEERRLMYPRLQLASKACRKRAQVASGLCKYRKERDDSDSNDASDDNDKKELSESNVEGKDREQEKGLKVSD